MNFWNTRFARDWHCCPRLVMSWCLVRFGLGYIKVRIFHSCGDFSKWRDCVGNALEWVALDMVRVDTPGSVSSFESSKERHDRWNRSSRRQLQWYRREAIRTRGIKFTDLEYHLNYYQYDGTRRGKEYFYNIDTTFSKDSMITYYPRHFVEFLDWAISLRDLAVVLEMKYTLPW